MQKKPKRINQPLRVLHVLKHVRNTGNGIVNVTVDLACAQAESGMAVWVTSGGGEYEGLFDRYGVRHIPIKWERRPANLIRAYAAFQRALSRCRPDIIHVHMVTEAMVAIASYRRRAPIVATVHRDFSPGSRLMFFANRIIAISEACGEALRRQGAASARVCIVPNGVLGGARQQQLNALCPVSLQRPAIITVAGLDERKGVFELLAAFEELAPGRPDLNLYYVGDGPARVALEAAASRSHWRSRIHLEGMQRNADGYLRAADVFVLASRAEPFGLALVEARQQGCAIVATNVGGIPDVLDGGRAGMLVPPRNPAALADAIAIYLDDKGVRAEYQQRARQDLERFSVASMVLKTSAVYSDVLNLGA